MRLESNDQTALTPRGHRQPRWALAASSAGALAMAMAGLLACVGPEGSDDSLALRTPVQPSDQVGNTNTTSGVEPVGPTTIPPLANLPYLSTASQVGDPLRPRFPSDGMADNFARSIRAMMTFGDKIHFGTGDYWNNTGRADIWALTESAGVIGWTLDFTVDDEMVDTFRVLDGTLYAPGADATEAWTFGNFYSKTGDTWTKHRSVPAALHVIDIAKLHTDLYVSMWGEREDNVLRSTDGGVRWTRLSKKAVDGRLIALDDVLLIFQQTKQGRVHVWDGVSLTTPHMKVFPDSGIFWPSPDRLVRFLDGVVYASVAFTDPEDSAPLFFLNDFAKGAAQVGSYGAPGGLNVRDIQVYDGVLYVMSTRPDPAQPGLYLGRVDATTDLASWSRLADFVVPAPPYSFALLQGAFYVGLGADGWWFESSAPASGSVWRLQQ